MGLRLRSKDNGESIFIHKRTILGRAADGSSVRVVNDREVSRQHAELYQGWVDNDTTPHWIIRDLQSSNGTFVNEGRVTGSQVLQNNDVIRIGQTRYQVTIDQTYIWQGDGDQAPQLERPHVSVPELSAPFVERAPAAAEYGFASVNQVAYQPQSAQSQWGASAAHPTPPVQWELLGFVGILGIGWFLSGRVLLGFMWLVAGLMVVAGALLFALLFASGWVLVGGWVVLFILTLLSTLLLYCTR